ncbi:MAG: BlaI/MecI/CopY family transcriptional regulator [Rhodothermales bacterium]
MTKSLHTHLSRRETQIMDVIYLLGEASVADVVARMPDEPAYNSIRVTLSILERKGYLKHRQEGQRYIYAPVLSTEKATRSALGHLLMTFFGGSPSKAILTLLDMSSNRFTQEDLDQLAERVEQARKEAEHDG